MLSRNEINGRLHQLGKLATAGYYIGLHIRLAAPLLQFQTYSEKWSTHYLKSGYTLRDPTIAWGFSTTGACRWSELPVPDPFNILKDAAAHGLCFGLTVSYGPLTSRSITSFARVDREFTDQEIVQIPGLVQQLHDLTEPPASLTRSQQEALRCVARGDRHAAAAAALGITESAFKARLISVRIRLGARTTAEALQRAQEYRLI